MRSLALEAVAVERRQRDEQVLGAELVVVAVDRDHDPAAVAQRSRDVLRVERGDRRRRLRHSPAEARAERPVVRLDLVAAELVGGGDEAQPLDVQLVANDRLETLDRRPLASARDDDRLAQGLAVADLRLGSRRPTEADRLAGGGHRELELRVALARPREMLEVDARLGRVEVVVDLVGHERRERRQQPGDRHQALAERREGRRIAVPEAPAASGGRTSWRARRRSRRSPGRRSSCRRRRGARRLRRRSPPDASGPSGRGPGGSGDVEAASAVAAASARRWPRRWRRRRRWRTARRSSRCSRADAAAAGRPRRPPPSRSGSRPTGPSP